MFPTCRGWGEPVNPHKYRPENIYVAYVAIITETPQQHRQRSTTIIHMVHWPAAYRHCELYYCFRRL